MGLTPMRVNRLSSGLPPLAGQISAEEPAEGAAARERGAVAAAAESSPVDFRRLRRVTRLLRIWFSKVRFSFFMITMHWQSRPRECGFHRRHLLRVAAYIHQPPPSSRSREFPDLAV